MQLASYARMYKEFEKRGAYITVISTGSPLHNKAKIEKLALPRVFLTTVALKRRFGEMRDRYAFREVERYQQMVKEYRGRFRRPLSRARGRPSSTQQLRDRGINEHVEQVGRPASRPRLKASGSSSASS